ncbi:MAG: peptidylprolyl isomerase [Planctomycetaceae bacterium]
MSALRRPARQMLVFVAAILAVVARPRVGTTVRFDTILGAIEVDLYEAEMPITVGNFITYANAGSYSSSLIHRSTTYNPADIQIVQGGGFTISGGSISPIATNPPIVFESGTYTNLRGTIAMARGAGLDTATSQFFFNVQDNPALDGNYAVFGKVSNAESLGVLDTIGSLPVYNLSDQLSPVFAETPLVPFEGNLYFMQVNRVEAVPEPSTMVLAAVGLAAAVLVRRRHPGRA